MWLPLPGGLGDLSGMFHHLLFCRRGRTIPSFDLLVGPIKSLIAFEYVIKLPILFFLMRLDIHEGVVGVREHVLHVQHVGHILEHRTRGA